MNRITQSVEACPSWEPQGRRRMERQYFGFCSSHAVVSMVAAGSLLAWLDPLTCSDPELPNSVAQKPSCGQAQ